jgi:outer membrane protein assembly factor BamB
MKRSLVTVLWIGLSSAASSVSSASAADWPHFRGPCFNGSTDETGLPSTWSSAEGILWTAELPGPSAATPVVWKDRVFVSSSSPEADALQALSLDAETGKLLWKHDVTKGIRRDGRSNFASGSPATDGEVVVFFYGNGELAAFDFAGERLWSRNLQKDYGEFAFLWTFSSSPLIHAGKLYIQVLQRDVPVDGRGFEDRRNESYLLALDPKTGQTLWRHVRPSDAVAESREAFSSPIPLEAKGRAEILVAGGDAVTGHDPATGKELWRWGGWNPERIGHWRLVPSPVVGRDIVLVCAPKRAPVYAIRAGGSGDLPDEAVAWRSAGSREIASDVPTPAFYDGDFFVLNDLGKSLSRVEAATGKAKWSVKTPGFAKYEASPLAADGKIYLVNFDGEVVVLDAKDGALLGVTPTNPTSEYPIRSTIVAARGRLFIRANRKMLCVGKR